MKLLKILHFKNEYYEALEKGINSIFKQLYLGIIDIIQKDIDQQIKLNAKNDLLYAILNGKLQYIGGHLEGQLNANLTKEIKKIGGVWDKKTKSFAIKDFNLPYDMRIAIGTSEVRRKELNNKIMRYLEKYDIEIPELEHYFFKTINNIEVDFKDGLKSITVPPEMNYEVLSKIAKDYAENMKLYIKNWNETSIKRLRDKIIDNTFNGYRSSKLITMIQHDYDVSKTKAKFLAEQETRLVLANYSKARYKDIGVDEYIWRARHDNKTRPEHRLLDGKICSFSNPPIVDLKTGRRANPAEDYNCRCVAQGIYK